MRLLLLVLLAPLCAKAAEPRHPAGSKSGAEPVREYYNHPDFHDPVSNGVPDSIESASEPVDVTIFWNPPKAPHRAISSENP